jgi:hypothetical protein
MVREDAQLYTMEGIAAGLIMLLTTYLVLGSTSVYTPGDTHITDMQLEQVGSDILRVMDTPLSLNNTAVNYRANRTTLELMVNTSDSDRFYQEFIGDYLCRSADPLPVARDITVGCGDIHVNASLWYVGGSAAPGSYPLPNPAPYEMPGPGVRVSHWVYTGARPGGALPADTRDAMRKEPQAMLVEVLMWKS